MHILAYNIHVTYSGIATAIALRTAGGLVSNILCGIFQNFVNNNQDLMLIIGYFIPAISIQLI